MGAAGVPGGLSNQPKPDFSRLIVIVIIPILIFYLLCQEKVEHGLASGAIKG